MIPSRRLERLRELYRVVEGLGPSQLDMDHWYQTNCKTTGCLLGWAANDPWFRRRGLSLQPSNLPWENSESDYQLTYRIRGMEWHCMDAAEEFFDLHYYDAEHLFMSSNERTPKATKSKALERIKAMIEHLENTRGYSSSLPSNTFII